MEIQPIEETHLYSYDYSLLEFFGHYEFGETITKADLANMRTLYGEYWNQKPFWDMLYITDMDSFTISEALKRVTQFDSDMMYNSDTLTAADYYKNSQDRLFLYWHGEEYKTYLESSAVSAESAVELQTVTATDGYQTLFQYIRTTAAEFSCVLDDGTKPYISGSEADLKYRIGKALYKPAINLQKLTRQEKYYSLCSSYTTLKDAFYQGTPDSRYSIETSYHYLLVCNDIFQAMKPEEREEVYQEAMAAYCRFRENGEFPSPKQIYLEYQEDAKGIVEDLNSQIIEDKKHELP